MKGRVLELAPPATEPATRDLPLAAFLTVRGVKLIGTRRYGHRVYFLFAAEGYEEHRTAWFGGDDLVSGRAYADAIKHLKQLLHEVLDRAEPEGA